MGGWRYLGWDYNVRVKVPDRLSIVVKVRVMVVGMKKEMVRRYDG